MTLVHAEPRGILDCMMCFFESAELGNQLYDVFVSRKGAKVSECIMWDMDCFQARKAGKPIV